MGEEGGELSRLPSPSLCLHRLAQLPGFRIDSKLDHFAFARTTINLINTQVTSNTASGDGGAIFLEGHILEATRSTLDNNTATGNGGAIYGERSGVPTSNPSQVTLTNTTVSGNTAADGDAVYLDDSFASFSHSTLSSNGSGVFTTNGAEADYKNTILAGNGVDCGGTVHFDSHGYNLIEAFTGGCDAGYTEVANPGTDLTDTDPLLEVLALNDGNGTAVQRPTHRLMDTSPAIDQGDGTTVAGGALSTDQRGAARPYDHPPVANAANGSDIGAFEAQADELPSDPIANDDAYNVDEGQTLNVAAPGVLDNDNDPGGNPLTAVLDTDVSDGTLTLNADGSFTYTPDGGFTGDDTFTYHANNGTSDSNIATVTITVNDINFTPVANDDAYNTDEEQVLNIAAPGVLGNDTDGDGDPLTAVLVSDVSDGTLALNADGSFTYTPDPDFSGTDTFTYQANDGTVNSNTATVTITVNAINDLPVANDDVYSVDEDQPLNIAAPGVLGNDTDADADPLTAVLDTDVANGILAFNADGSFSYTPDANFNGTDTFTYHANDGTGDSNIATVTITVDPIADAPVANNDAYATNQDEALNLAAPGVLGNDTDADGDALTAALVSDVSDGTLTLNADGSFTYTPDAGFVGTDMFTYQANDGSANSNVATVTITVNDVDEVPVANNDAYAVDEDQTLNIAAVGVLGNDTDPDGDPLTAVLNTDVANGTLAFNADGSFTYTPDPNFNGTDTFTYHANDGANDSNIATVTITVNPIADAPQAAGDQYTVDEGQTLNLAAPGVLGNDTDADSDALTAALVSDVSNGTLALSADGSFTYTPEANFSGTDTFTYQANDGSANSNVTTVTITVNETNDAPVANNDAYATNQGEPLTVFPSGVLGNDTDPDGDPLTTVLVSGVSNGLFTLESNGAFTYIPNAGFNGTDTFTYQANDGTVNSDTATVTITVNSIGSSNEAPIANDDAYSVDEGQALNVAIPGVLDNDTDADGDALTATLVSNVSDGTLTLNADGSFTYTPDANFNGTDTFTYQANDGTANSNVATVTITVNAVNDAPVANNDTYTTGEAELLTVTAPGVLGNDTDADGDALTSVLVSNVASGTLVFNADGSFTYTPDAGFIGTDTFTYQTNDGTVNSNTATVTITVNNINDAPIATDDGYNVDEDQTLMIVAPGVLGNDTDADSDALTAALVSDVSNGTLALSADGSFTYTPEANFSGTDTFTYQASDGTVNSNVATVTITVAPVNDAPVSVDDAVSTPSNIPISIAVLDNDSDVDGTLDPASVQVEDAPSNGTATVDTATGMILYDPAGSAQGDITFTYTVADDLGARSAAATVTVAVQNRPPIAQNDAASTFPGVAVVINVLANDSDPEGGALSIDAVTTPANGTVTINADGTITYMPVAGFSGSDAFTYTIRDVAGSTASAEVTITITCLFDIVDLGTLGGVASRAFGLNEAGEVVGISETADGTVQGFLWSGGVPMALGTGTTSQALGIDEVIVGAAQVDNLLRAVQLSSVGVNDLNAPDVAFSVAFGTQGSQAVGTYVEGDTFSPFIVRGGFSMLEVPDGGGGQALAVNEAGQVAGFSMTGEALMWQATGEATSLGAGRAFGINASGQVAGTNGSQAVRWEADGTPLLLDAGGVGFAEAYGINDVGAVVGTAAAASKQGGAVTWHTARDLFTIVQSAMAQEQAPAAQASKGAVLQGGAYLWQGGVVTDLNACLPAGSGWVLEDARAINDLGQVVGYGVNGGAQRAYLLTPQGNTMPAAKNDRAITDAVAPVRIDLLANDLDADGDTLRVLRVLPSTSGTITTHTDGTVTYQPQEGFAGEDRFVYIVTDGRGAADRAEVVVEVNAPTEVPTEYALEQNYPNPFNPSTTIRYALPASRHVRVTIYNLLGQHLRTLVDGVQEVGVHTIHFEADGLPSGVYFYRMEAGTQRMVRQMTLIR